MKILYICADPGVPVFGRKGCSTHVRETCLALVDAGHEVKVITSNAGGDEARRDELEVIEVEPYKSKKLGYDVRNRLTDWRVEEATRKLVQSWKPDAIYERYSLYSRTGTKLARKLNLPHILEVNAFITREQTTRLKLPKIAEMYERRIIREARHVVVVSEPLREEIGKLRGTDDEISRMPMAVNLEHFSPEKTDNGLRAKLGLKDQFIIGYVGTLTGWHGIRLLYDLARKLQNDFTDFQILVVGGEGTKLEMHQKKVESEDLSRHLQFVGAVPYQEVPHYMRMMDVALVPDTTYWSSPAKLFEYQGSGIPVIAPRYPAIESAMINGEEGFIFEPENIDEMARRIRELYQKPELKAEMGRKARARAAGDHSWESQSKRVIAVFESQMATL